MGMVVSLVLEALDMEVMQIKEGSCRVWIDILWS